MEQVSEIIPHSTLQVTVSATYFSIKSILKSMSFRYSKCDAVWRGVAKDVSEGYRVGDEFTWWSLTSTTSSFDVLQSPMYLGREQVQTIFLIETKCGKSIREHSHLMNDDEILLLPGIALKVTEGSKQADGIHTIHLRDADLFGYQSIHVIPQLDQYRNPRLEEIIRASEVRGRLTLDSINLNDQDMEIVVKLGIVEKKSHSLSLCHNAITSVGASILSQVFLNGICIYALNLEGNRILDAGVQFLCRGLANQDMGTKFLYLNSNGISDTGCEYLAEMLQVHRSIIYLHLNDNEISDRGVRVLLETIRSPDCNISLMTLSGNKLITDASVDIICSVMYENRGFSQLQLRNCSLSPAGKERLQMAAQQISFSVYV